MTKKVVLKSFGTVSAKLRFGQIANPVDRNRSRPLRLPQLRMFWGNLEGHHTLSLKERYPCRLLSFSGFTYCSHIKNNTILGLCYASVVVGHLYQEVQGQRCSQGSLLSSGDSWAHGRKAGCAWLWILFNSQDFIPHPCGLFTSSYLAGLPTGWTKPAPLSVKDDLTKLYPWLAEKQHQDSSNSIYYLEVVQ